MDIEVQRGGDVRVSEQRAQSLHITFALKTSGRESVPQAMVFSCLQSKRRSHFLEISPERLRIKRLAVSGQDVLVFG